MLSIFITHDLRGLVSQIMYTLMQTKIGRYARVNILYSFQNSPRGWKACRGGLPYHRIIHENVYCV